MRSALQHIEQAINTVQSARCRAFHSALRSLLLDCVKQRDREAQTDAIDYAYKWFSLQVPTCQAGCALVVGEAPV